MLCYIFRILKDRLKLHGSISKQTPNPIAELNPLVKLKIGSDVLVVPCYKMKKISIDIQCWIPTQLIVWGF